MFTKQKIQREIIKLDEATFIHKTASRKLFISSKHQTNHH